MSNGPKNPRFLKWLPMLAAAVCVLAFCAWLSLGVPRPQIMRVPIARATPAATQAAPPANPGTLIAGKGKPSLHPGSWPQFRGPRRDNIAVASAHLARSWPEAGPPVLWRIPVGEGYAAAAIHQGRVYVIDYDRDKQEDAIRCLSLDNGEEIWRYTYSVEIKRNHGMSRTIPAVNDRFVVALGPMCHVHCLDATTGKLVWKKDLVQEQGTVVPLWYAGQCPLIEGDRLILAPGGKPLMMAVDLATGKTIWETKDLPFFGMTHSSIVPMEFGGQRQYVYCGQQGVVGVAADDGRVLWTKPDWKISIANVPSPTPIGDGRILFSGGYNAGCAMVRLKQQGATWTTEEIFRLKPTVFGADQQTPILYENHIYGVIPSGELVCLNLDGTRVWDSGSENRFGVGPFLIADGLIVAFGGNDGTLHLAKADALGYNELAKAKLMVGSDGCGPMAFAEGRVVLRNFTQMACVDLGG